MRQYRIEIKQSDSEDQRGYPNWVSIYEQQTSMLDLWEVVKAVNKAQNEANQPEVNP